MAHTHKLVDGQRIELTAEEITELNAKDVIENEKMAERQVTYDALEYSRNRAKEYPTWQDQLDYIYHNGIDAWKATIKVTKDKYPKP